MESEQESIGEIIGVLITSAMFAVCGYFVLHHVCYETQYNLNEVNIRRSRPKESGKFQIPEKFDNIEDIFLIDLYDPKTGTKDEEKDLCIITKEKEMIFYDGRKLVEKQ